MLNGTVAPEVELCEVLAPVRTETGLVLPSGLSARVLGPSEKNGFGSSSIEVEFGGGQRAVVPRPQVRLKPREAWDLRDLAAYALRASEQNTNKTTYAALLRQQCPAAVCATSASRVSMVACDSRAKVGDLSRALSGVFEERLGRDVLNCFIWLDMLCVNQGWLHQLRTRLREPDEAPPLKKLTGTSAERLMREFLREALPHAPKSALRGAPVVCVDAAEARPEAPLAALPLLQSGLAAAATSAKSDASVDSEPLEVALLGLAQDEANLALWLARLSAGLGPDFALAAPDRGSDSSELGISPSDLEGGLGFGYGEGEEDGKDAVLAALALSPEERERTRLALDAWLARCGPELALRVRSVSLVTRQARAAAQQLFLRTAERMLDTGGDDERALRLGKRALALQRELDREAGGKSSAGLAAALNCCGALQFQLGRFKKALVLHEEALEVLRTLEGERRSDTAAHTLKQVGLALMRVGRIEEARDSTRRALAELESNAGARSLELAQAHNALGEAMAGLGRWDEALPRFAAALDCYIKVLPWLHAHSDARAFAKVLTGMAATQHNAGDLAGAQRTLERAADCLDARSFALEAGRVRLQLGQVLFSRGDAQAALRCLVAAEGLLRGATATVDQPDPANSSSSSNSNSNSISIGIGNNTNSAPAAEAEAEAALDTVGVLLVRMCAQAEPLKAYLGAFEASAPRRADVDDLMAQLLDHVACALAQRGHLEQARTCLQDAQELARGLPPSTQRAERDVIIAQHLEDVSSGRPLVDTRLDSKMERLCASLPRTASAIAAAAVCRGRVAAAVTAASRPAATSYASARTGRHSSSGSEDVQDSAGRAGRAASKSSGKRLSVAARARALGRQRAAGPNATFRGRASTNASSSSSDGDSDDEADPSGADANAAETGAEATAELELRALLGSPPLPPQQLRPPDPRPLT